MSARRTFLATLAASTLSLAAGSARGQWVIPDVQAVLTERMKKP